MSESTLKINRRAAGKNLCKKITTKNIFITYLARYHLIYNEVRVIPHFDKFFKWMPDSAAKHLLDLPGDSTLIGIDEDTAVVKRANQDWQVWGKGKLHLLKGHTPGQFGAAEFVKLGGDIL